MMDPSKLDKMKVVELRAELTARGLDSKGVKAVLVDRLKAALEVEAPVVATAEREPSVPPPGTPVAATPGRRGRRTRSMTRSPSPPKKAEPALETLDEEPRVENVFEKQEKGDTKEKKLEDKTEKSKTTRSRRRESEVSDEPPAKKKAVSTKEKSSPVKEKITPQKDKTTPVKEEPALSPVKDAYAPSEEISKQKLPKEKSIPTKEKAMPAKENMTTTKEKTPAKEKTSSAKEDATPFKEKLTPPKESEISPKEKDETYELNETMRVDDIEDAKDTSVGSSIPEDKSGTEPEKMDVDIAPRVDKDIEEEWKLDDEESKEKADVSGRKRSFSKSPSRSRSRSKSLSRSPSQSRSRSRSFSRSQSRSHSRSSRSRSHSASGKRQGRKSPELNADDFTNEEDEPIMEDKQFGLSWFDSDLHLRIDPVAFNSAKPLSEDAFALVWSGARTNYGVRSGKILYEVRLSEEVSNNHFCGEDHLFGFRCGFSLPNTNLMLGESQGSFAYCESGKKVLNGEFVEYGKPYGLDDVIGCYLDLDSTPCKIEFTVNGERLGTAFEFDKDLLGENDALYPHILTKGYEFQINFADNENLLANVERPKRIKKVEEPIQEEKKKESEKKETYDLGEEDWDDDVPANPPKDEECFSNDDKSETEEDSADKVTEEEERDDIRAEKQDVEEKSEGDTEHRDDIADAEIRTVAHLLPGYELIGLIAEELLIPGPQRPESRKDCEVYLLVGLPGSGKTHWVTSYVKQHPDKRFDVIGPDSLIEKMKVDGKPRKEIHIDKWDKVYELCLKSVSALEEIATKRRRNFILDQTNVFASCQRRKMKGFGDFKRIAVVCIPSEDELKRRNDLKTEAQGINLVKESSLNKMKANFTLPSIEFGWFDEVRYVDLEEEDAKDEIKKYNEKGKKAIQSSQSKYKRPRRDNYRRDDRKRRDERRRSDFRGPRWKNNDRRGQSNRWGPPSSRGGNWREDRGYGGGGYDRRDSRYSSGGPNWAHNSRPRYDDRFYRPQSSGRYEYGGGRDYRDRYDRDRNGSGGRRDSNRGGSHRDFRGGHRDNRSEDSRGGYERSSSKYSDDAYDYKNSRSGNSSSKSTNGSASQGKWMGQQPQQQPPPNWGPQSQHQAYWNYDQMQAYGAPQPQQPPQWPINSADPRQQQQWMNWWQQQQGNHAMANNQQYWTQYAQQAAYAQPPASGMPHVDGTTTSAQRSMSGSGSRSESKKP